MQFKPLTLIAAFAAGVSAQAAVDQAMQVSVLAYFAGNLPASDLALAATNTAAFISGFKSSLEAGNVPQWYQTMPQDVKSALADAYPMVTEVPASTTAADAVETSSASAHGTGTGTGHSGNSTSVTSVNSPTLSRTSGSTQPSQTGAAAAFQVVGAGLAGVFGFMGVLAL